MSEQPTTTLQIWPTASGDRWFCTCPWHHKPPLIVRDFSAEVVMGEMTDHVAKAHGWKVIGSQVLAPLGVSPNPDPGLETPNG